MIPYFILGLALLVAAVFFVRWFVNADPKDVLKVLRWILVVAGAAFAVLLLIFGTSLLVPLMMFLFTMLMLRGGLGWKRMKAAAGPTPGQSSGISTRFLNMTLDHDSGRMNGEVLEGRFAGRMLDQMSFAELLELLRECRAADEESASVLQAYLERMRAEDWEAADAGGGSDGSGRTSGAGPGIMTKEEAYAILGLEEGAGAREIREAHRRLMQKIHPDHGGSNYLAAKINQAKSLLLGE